jgi:multiple sugar transport system substrate-binding protein
VTAGGRKEYAMPALNNLPTRRQLLLGSAALAGTAMTAGCRSGSTSQSAGGPVTLQVSVWLGAEELTSMKKLVTQFNKEYPDIKVQFINIVNGGPYGMTKLQQMIAGGTPPDVMMLNSGQFESFAARGALASLEEKVAEDKVDLGVYWPQAVEGCKLQDKLFGMPKDMSDVLVYLNKALFDQAKVPLPGPDWTWTEYREAAIGITRTLAAGGKARRWGTIAINSDWAWSPFVWTNGGEVYADKQCRLTDPKAKEALTFYFGLQVEDKAAPSGADLASFGGEGSELAAFIGGSVGFGIAGPWLRPGLINAAKKIDWTIRPLPNGPDGQPSIIPVFTDMWGMSARTEHPDEAWTLVKWLSGQPGQQGWLDIYGGRSITPIQELATGDEWLEFGGPEHREDNQAILDALDPQRTRRPAVAFENGAEAQTLWDNQFKVVSAGRASVEQATANVCGRLTGILERGA